MTIDELRQLIQDTPELLALAKAGNDSGLAAAISSSLPKVPKPDTFIAERGLYALLGVEAGEIFLQTIEALAATDGPLKATFARVERWLKDGIGLDVGLPTTQQMLATLSVANGGPFADASVAAIIEYGSQAQSVTADEVSAALADERSGDK